jgi:mannosyltransferase OCH1-like enzyme
VSIPRIIHQTWKSAEVPGRFQAAARSWRDRHPGWEYVLWTDADIDRFVRDHFPQLVTLFQRYPDQIQRVDAFRYLLLQRVGGVYADLDIECLRSFEPLREHRVVLPRTAPVGLSNDLMMATPGHPLFQALIDGLPAAFRAWQHWWIPRHFRVLETTGSLYITRIHRQAGSPDVYLLPPTSTARRIGAARSCFICPATPGPAGTRTRSSFSMRAGDRWPAGAEVV